MFSLSSVNRGFGFDLVPVLRRRNWKDVSMVVICYGLTVIVSKWPKKSKMPRLL